MLIEISAHVPGAKGASAAGTFAQGMRTMAVVATGTLAAEAHPVIES
jgi:hypothetical protein